MKKFNIKTIEGDFEIEGTHYSMMKYFIVYKDNEEVFTMRTNKILSVQ